MNDKLKQACAYIRVSTDDQLELSPTSQKQKVIEYCQKNGYIISENDFYADLGISGKFVDRRDGFKQMVAMCKSKEHPYDAVIVWKFSRFARNQEESIVYKSMLRKIGVEVISISEPISEGLGGKLTEAILEIMDEYYSINLSQEVMRGMSEGARQGKRMSIAPYGYVLKDHELVIEPSEAEIVKFFFSEMLKPEVKLQTLTFDVNRKEIRTKSGKRWETRSLKYLLQNPVYIGKIRWNYATHDGKPGTTRLNDESEWIIVDGTHEPIISQEVFEQVQQKLLSSKRAIEKRRLPQAHWLSGIMKCGYCGCGMSYHTSYNDSRGHFTPAYFVCQDYNRGKCTNKNSRKTETIENKFFEALEEQLDNTDLLKPKIVVETVSDPRIIEYEKQLAENEKRMKRAKQAYLDGIDEISEYKANKRVLEDERNLIKERLEKCLESQNTQPQTDIKTALTNLIDILKSDRVSVQEKHLALSEIVEKIVYTKKDENDEETLDIYFKGV